MAAERLGIPVEEVDIGLGDSDSNVPSAGAVASRSTMSVGSAVYAAVDAVIEKGRRAAAQILEAAEADIAYRDGVFEISGTGPAHLVVQGRRGGRGRDRREPSNT